ncbi:unnamed protein product, partial [Tilletia controversa]
TPDHPDKPEELPGESAEQMTARVDGVIAKVRALQKAVTEGHPETLHSDAVMKHVFIGPWLGLPITTGRGFEVDAGGMALLTYTHNTFDEPAIGAISSAKTGPKPVLEKEEDTHLKATSHTKSNQYLALVKRVIDEALSPIQPAKWHASSPHDQASVSAWSARGTALVCGGKDGLQDPLRAWHLNLGREWLESVPRLPRPHEPTRRRSRTCLYGFQWRHFGAKYIDCDTDYTGQGVDQLAECVRKIKENPTDRRILLSAWNPADLEQMTLKPCHMFCQFYVSLPSKDAPPSSRPVLSCQMYQRSCDLGLGTRRSFQHCQLCSLDAHGGAGHECEAGELVLSMGDAHVYRDHVEPLKTQLARDPRPFPTNTFARQVSNINDFNSEDVVVQGYAPHGKIEVKMSV